MGSGNIGRTAREAREKMGTTNWSQRLRRFAYAIVASVILFAVGSSSANAVKIQNPSPPDFYGELTGGFIQLGGQGGKLFQLPLDFASLNQPNPSFRGTINAAGDINVPQSQLVFPPMAFDVLGSIVSITLQPTHPATGRIDPLSGRVDFRVRLRIKATGTVTVTDPVSLTVNLGDNCYVGSPSNPIDIQGKTHLGNFPDANDVYVADFTANPAEEFEGGLMPAGPYSDEPGVWPIGPKPGGLDYEFVPRDAGTFRLADESLAAPTGGGCGSSIVDDTLNSELGLPSIPGASTAILDFKFVAGGSRTGPNAIVQKGVKSNFVATGFSSGGWPSTEVPEIPTQVPFSIDASGSQFAAGVGPNPSGAYSFDLGSGTYGAFTNDAVQPLSFMTPGERTIRVRARDAQGDIDFKTRTINVVPSADIAVSQGADGGSFRGGSNGTLVVSVSNEDPDRSNTQPVNMTTDIPAGTSFLSVDAPGAWTCSFSAPTVNCDLPTGELEGSGSDQIEINLSVDAAAPNPTPNTATVEQFGDPVSENNTSTVDIPVRKTDAQISLSHTGDVVANGTLTYDVAVENIGDGETSGPTSVNLTLPPQMTFRNAGSGGTGWSCVVNADPQNVTCTQSDQIPGGGEAPALSVVAKVDRMATGTLTSTASISAQGDTNAFGGNNSDSDDAEILVLPDLALYTQVSGDFIVGDDETATFEITNESVLSTPGPTQLTSELPEGLTISSIAGSGWDCAATTTESIIDCSYSDDLDPLESAPGLVAHLDVDHAAYPATSLTGVISNAEDAFEGNDSSTTDVDVRRLDVAITKSAVRSFSVGIEGQYRLSVSNVGDASTVGQIRVLDELPPQLTLAGVSGGGWDCSASVVGQQTVDCVSNQTVTPGSGAPVLTVRVNVLNEAADLGEVVNVATVDTERDDRNVATDDPVTGNNSDEEVTKAVSVDLSIESTHGATFRVGTQQIYSLKIRNVGFFGTQVGEPVTVIDQLPLGMVPVEEAIWQDRPGWSCDAEDLGESAAPEYTVTCTLPAPDEVSSAMVKGSTATIEIPVNIADPAVDPSINVAEVSTMRDDNVDRSPNNRSEDHTNVTRIDLETSASVSVAPRAAAQGEISTQVNNIGTTGTVNPTKVTIPLPLGVTYRPQGSTVAGWQCTTPGNSIECLRSPVIPAGVGAPPLVTRLNVTAEAPDSWVTDLQVRSVGEVDERLGNNDVSLDQELEKIDLRILKAHDAGTIKSGQRGEYRLSVENVGNTASTGVTAVDETVPADFTNPTASGSGWNCDIASQDLHCTRTAPIGAGQVTPPVTVSFFVPADRAGTRNSVATVSNPGDPYPGNDSIGDPITIVASADAALTVDQPSTMRVGEVTHVTYKVSNVGTESTSGSPSVRLSVLLPEGVEPAGTQSSDPWDCETSPVGETGMNFLSCSLSRALETGDNSQVTATLRLDSAPSPQVDLLGSVKTVGDSNIENDYVARQSSATGVDLAVDVEAPTETMEADVNNRRIIRVSNEGTIGTNGDITVKVPLPDGVRWSNDTSVVGSGWQCAQPVRQVECSQSVNLMPDETLPVLNLDLLPSRSNAPSVDIEYSVETLNDENSANDSVIREETVLYYPETTIHSAPSGTTTSTSASVEFSSDDQDATFECKLDLGEYEACTSPYSVDGLSLGGHSVLVRAVNATEMKDATPAESNWTVIANAPTGNSVPLSGSLTGGELGLAALGSVELPAGQLKLNGQIYENGAVQIPQEGVEFLPVEQEVEAPGFGMLRVKISISATGPGSGNFTNGGGEATFNLPVQAKLEAYVGDSALIGPDADCFLRPIQFALSGTWDEAAMTATLASGGVAFPTVSAGCGFLGETVNSLLELPRSDIAISLDFALEKGLAACTEGQVGTPPDCVSPAPNLTKVVLKAPKKVKSGKKFAIRASVKNNGSGTASNVKVCLQTPKKLIAGKAKRCITVKSIAAGKTGTVNFKIKAKKAKKKAKKKTKVKFTVTAPTGAGSKTGKVRGHVTVLK